MEDGTKENPYTREDVLRLIEENGGTADGLVLSRATFVEAIDLSGLDLHGIILREAKFPTSFKHEIVEGADLRGSHLEKADLTKAHFERADLHETHLEGANLRDAHLEGARLWDTHLEDANLLRAHLEGRRVNIDLLLEAGQMLQ
ncbi:pentapeptide repeat-containing protein [Chloroflexota bacterium]